MRILHTSVHKQSGIALIISFIILLLLTIIGVSGMKVTGLEEKMAGNDRDQNVAFQSAEAALRAGEARVNAVWNNGTGSIQTFCNGTAGLFHEANLCANDSSANAPAPFADETWTNDAKSVAVTTVSSTDSPSGNKLVAEPPRYYISYAGRIAPMTGKTEDPPAYRFIVTARGVGGQAGSQVVLRSYFGGTTSFAP